MFSKKTSYLFVAFLFAMTLSPIQGLRADVIYLEPDTLLLTGAVGSEFDLDLKVDAVQNLKFFKAYFTFNPGVLDTVSFTQGPLFPSSGAGTWPGGHLFSNDTVIALEDLIYGAGLAVDGPGVLFTVRFRAIAPGKADFYPINHVLRDIVGDTIESEMLGSTIFVDYPPVPINLLQPFDGELFDKYPRDSIALVWSSTASVYPGEGVSCRLEYGLSESFASESTLVVSGLLPTDTTYSIYTADLESGGIYFWRVVATGDLYGYERVVISSFDLNLMDPIAGFNMTLPVGGQVSRYPMDSIMLVWKPSSSVFPSEGVVYRLEYGTSGLFDPAFTTIVPDISETTYPLYVDDLAETEYYWRITAVGDNYGYERLASNLRKSFVFKLMVPFVPFILLSPTEGETVVGPPSGFAEFDWSESQSVYPGETVSYRFELSVNPSFETLTVPAITGADSDARVLMADLESLDYFWRVTAIGDTYGFETLAIPFSNYFSVEIGATEPAPFSLRMPTDSSIVNIAHLENVTLEWDDADVGDPYDTMQYVLFMGPDTNFLSSAVLVDTTWYVPGISIPTSDLPLAQSLFWRVLAKNRFDLERWSTSANQILFYVLGDVTGNSKINLADITKIIDFVYLSKVPPIPKESADVTCDGKANLADITRLIDHVYISKEDIICP